MRPLPRPGRLGEPAGEAGTPGQIRTSGPDPVRLPFQSYAPARRPAPASENLGPDRRDRRPAGLGNRPGRIRRNHHDPGPRRGIRAGPCHFADCPSPGDRGRRHARLADHPHRGRRRPSHRRRAPGPRFRPAAGPPSPDDTRWPVPGTSRAWILATVQARSAPSRPHGNPHPFVARRQKPRSASLKRQTPKGDQSRITAGRRRGYQEVFVPFAALSSPGYGGQPAVYLCIAVRLR